MIADHAHVEAILKKYFTYDRIFNLVDYDENMSQLYSDLKDLQKDSYDPNYRFIFTHYDTDYYITNDQPGLILRNLQRILRELDISNYFCIILTIPQIQHHLDLLREQETNDSHSIQSIVEMAHPGHHHRVDSMVKNNIEHITKKYICLNGVDRQHRSVLYSFLYHKNLLEYGMVSYKNFINDSPISTQTHSLPRHPIPAGLTLLQPTPYTRINDRWIIKDPELISMLQSTPGEPYKNFNDTFERFPTAVELAQQAFLYVITETTFNYPDCNLSEKTFKPIISKRPFLLVSSSGGLKKLKDFGFKTFDQWWCEDYDNIVDPTERLKAVVKIIEDISCKSLEELKKMYSEMQEIIDYNFNYHQNNFYIDQLTAIDNGCKNNLGYR